jgi:hypothetical protein
MRLRVHRAPGIPHALNFQGELIVHHSGASRRESAGSRLASLQGEPTVRANARSMTGSATKHSTFAFAVVIMDCFASARNDDAKADCVRVL